MAKRWTEARTWRDAQRQVAFPLHRPRTPATRISVRPWTPRLWPTVVSDHKYRGATIRLKQFVDGWSPTSWPVLLSYLVGHDGDGRVRVYGPPLEPFFLDRMPCCHAGHSYGVEGGAAISHMVFMDVVVRDGHLGKDGLREFLRGLNWADPRASPARYRRPLYEWSWSLQEQRHMWSWPRAQRWPRQLIWSTRPADAKLGAHRFILPRVPGFTLDSVGRGPRELRVYFRPSFGHQPLVVAYYRGPAPELRSEGPIYEHAAMDMDGTRAEFVRVPAIGGMVLSAARAGMGLLVAIPPASLRDSRDRPAALARPFIRGLPS